jgi:hypothetical protein
MQAQAQKAPIPSKPYTIAQDVALVSLVESVPYSGLSLAVTSTDEVAVKPKRKYVRKAKVEA